MTGPHARPLENGPLPHPPHGTAGASSPFEAAFEHLPLPCALTQGGRTVAVNTAWCRLAGQTPGEALAGPLDESGLAQRHRLQVRTQALPSDGAALRLVCLVGTDTVPAATNGAHPPGLDPEVRVRLELHDEIEKLARVGAWTNIDGQDEVVWSEGLREIARWPRERRLDFHSARSGLHPDDRDAWLAARETMDGQALEHRWIDGDGNTRWFRTRMGRCQVLGRPDTAFGIVQDISAERAVREQLRAQLDLLNQTAQHVPGLMYQARGLPDGGTEITFMSSSARRLLELAPHESETDARTVFSRVHPQDLPTLLADMARCARDVIPWRNRYRVRLPSGAERWFRFEAAPSPQPDGAVLWHGYIADVTEDRRARQRLERQQRLLDAVRSIQSLYISAGHKSGVFARLLAEIGQVIGPQAAFLADLGESGPGAASSAIDGALLGTDPAGGRLRIDDPAIRDQLQRGHCVILSAEHAGHRGVHGYLRGDAPLVLIPLRAQQALAGILGLQHERPDEVVEQLAFLEPMTNAASQMLLARQAASAQAATLYQLAQTSEQLDTQRRALQITLDSMGQGLAKIEADGRVSFYNRRMLELLNVPESLMASYPTHAEVSAYLAQRGDFGTNFEFVDLLARDYVSSAGTGSAPSIYLRQTQAGHYLEVGTRELPEGGAVRTITDVSSYVRSQQELALERQRLATLNSSLERMVKERTGSLERTLRDMEAIAYSIAHDLRAPLRSVNGFASVLIDDEQANLSPAGVQTLARIVNASRRMGQMLTEMLDVLAVVRADLVDGEVDVAALARDIDEQLGMRAAGVALTIDTMPVARGDEKLIKQALRNLMDNAWKYARERTPPSVHVGFDEAQGAYFVRDNGVGFDMARSAKLFGLFQRLHTDASIPGLGIGLAITSRIVERHGGQVWAVSAAGEGATFWVRLPMPV
ncbi:MAG: PAS-domain containing protein [Hydrogenophaga sp.]|nr:PAS-domain containing protein [Hydrogenophaga sp.]